MLAAYTFGQVMWSMFVFFMWILFFWLGLSSTVIVICASLSPVLAGRRTYLAAEDEQESARMSSAR